MEQNSLTYPSSSNSQAQSEGSEDGRKKRFDGGIGGEELVCSTVLTISTAKDEPITLKVKIENINIRSRKKVGKEGVEEVEGRTIIRASWQLVQLHGQYSE